MSRIVLANLGGGTQSIYGSSVLYTLATKYQVTNFDLAFFASSSYITAGYFFSKQPEVMKDFLLQAINTPKLFNILNYFKNQPIIDLDYLIRTILQGTNSIQAESLKEMVTEIFCPLINLTSGEVEWHSNKNPNYDYWQLLRAAMTLPGYTAVRGSMYLGNEYMDGVVIDFREVLARLQPGDKLLVIKSQPYQLKAVPLFKMFRIFYRENYLTLPKHLTLSSFYQGLVEESSKAFELIKQNHEVLEIAPPKIIVPLWDPRLNRFNRIWSFAENQLAQKDWQEKISNFLNHD
jgi:predicted patatin/cPLA2 family phospholipase